MKKLNIAHQLFVLVGALMAAFAVAVYFQLTSFTQDIYRERFDMLRTQVEAGISVMDQYNERVKAGELTLEAAKAEAYKVLSKVKYEPNGYLFGNDYDVVLQFHPSPKLIGKNMSESVDADGVRFSYDMTQLGRNGGGITHYLWGKPGQPEDETYPKAAYSLAYEPWKIVVGTGVYVDDLQAQVRATVLKALAGCATDGREISRIGAPSAEYHRTPGGVIHVAKGDQIVAAMHVGKGDAFEADVQDIIRPPHDQAVDKAVGIDRRSRLTVHR